jgi:hypothetical protein
MSSADDYRSYAQECFDWARTAKSERERDIFLEMTRTWLVAAIRAVKAADRVAELQPRRKSRPSARGYGR